jgi:hypothetical protein
MSGLPFDRRLGRPTIALSRSVDQDSRIRTILRPSFHAATPDRGPGCDYRPDSAQPSLAISGGSTARRRTVARQTVDFRHHQLVTWLLEHRANVNARTDSLSRHTALHAAAWNGDLPVGELLVRAGADLAARDEQYDGTANGNASDCVERTRGCAIRWRRRGARGFAKPPPSRKACVRRIRAGRDAGRDRCMGVTASGRRPRSSTSCRT